MASDPSVREISVDFARTIANELRIGDGYFEISPSSAHIVATTQCAEDMIERYIRRAIERDRERRKSVTEICLDCDCERVLT